jgi:hypothetical protein
MKEEYDFSKMKGKKNPHAKRLKEQDVIGDRKEIPVFKDEDEEREFWSKNSPLDFMDLDSARIITLKNSR